MLESPLKNIHRLHVLRGFAAFVVVVFHAKYILWCGGTQFLVQHPRSTWSPLTYLQFSIDTLSSSGGQWVLLFFLLSAFVIQHSTEKGWNLPVFYRNRLIRIYPPYLAAMGLGVLFTWLSVQYINPAIATTGSRDYNGELIAVMNNMSWKAFFRGLVFLDTNDRYFGSGVFWSLTHEMVFYIFFPLYRLLKPWQKAVGAVIWWAIFYGAVSQVAYYQMYFLIGLLLYDYFRAGYRLPVRLPRWLNFLLVFGLFVAVNVVVKKLPWPANEYGGDFVTLVFTFFAFDFFLHQPVTIPRPLAWLADISYSMYLNHGTFLMLFYAVITRLTGQLVFVDHWPYYLGIVAAVGLSAPLYYLTEQPTIRLLKRLKQQTPHKAAPPAEAATLPIPPVTVE